MSAAFLAASAITPSLLLVWYFHARDVFREPARVLWTTFALGAVIVAPVLVFAWPAYLMAQEIENPLLHGFTSAFLGAAIPEEFFKFLVLWLYAMRHSEFDEPMDGIVYGATASLGFATLENILYVADGGSAAAIMRAFTAVPGHAFLGAIMGYYAGRAHAAPQPERRSLLVRALVIPTLLHGAYDFPLLSAAKLEDPATTIVLPVLALLLLVPVILSIELIWTLRAVRYARAAQLARPTPVDSPLPPIPPPSAEVAAAAEVATTGPRPGRFVGWLLTLFGGLLASLGGLLILGVLLASVFEGTDAEEVPSMVLGTVLIGVLPALIGSGLFAKGMRRLNRT